MFLPLMRVVGAACRAVDRADPPGPGAYDITGAIGKQAESTCVGRCVTPPLPHFPRSSVSLIGARVRCAGLFAPVSPDSCVCMCDASQQDLPPRLWLRHQHQAAPVQVLLWGACHLPLVLYCLYLCLCYHVHVLVFEGEMCDSVRCGCFAFLAVRLDTQFMRMCVSAGRLLDPRGPRHVFHSPHPALLLGEACVVYVCVCGCGCFCALFLHLCVFMLLSTSLLRVIARAQFGSSPRDKASFAAVAAKSAITTGVPFLDAAKASRIGEAPKYSFSKSPR